MGSTRVKVAVSEAKRFMVDCFKAVGVKEEPAMDQAELLVQADKMGHQSHGLNTLENYIHDIKNKLCEPNNAPIILKEGPATAWVDGNNCLGATSSLFGVNIAMSKAKENGVGWVTVKGSNPNGSIGYWSKLCADNGYLGMAFTNTFPQLTPTRSKEAVLGTNPLSVVAPASCGETFFLEMATTAVTLNAIETKRRAGEPLPLGWALGPDGKETTDAEVALKTGKLLPLGGTEETSGYKGYGLSAAVEVLSGICADSNYGHKIPKWQETAKVANIGHCFVAVNLDCFSPGFAERLLDCMKFWRSMEPVNSALPVLAPGDVEKQNAAEVDKTGGIMYLKQQIDDTATLAENLQVQPIKVVEETLPNEI